MVELEALIKKLNSVCHGAIQKAAELCVSNTNYNVEIEHLILQLVNHPDSDITIILHHYDIEIDKVLKQCTKSVELLKRGNSRTPAMSPHIVTLFQEAWMQSSMTFNEKKIRSGSLLIGLLANQMLRGLVLESVPILLKIPFKNLGDDFKDILKESPETPGSFVSDRSDEESSADESGASGEFDTPILNQYTVDITQQAQQGLLDPVECRDNEIRQIIDILMRRRQNNPILTGEAGVGKTAIVEGFAMRVVKDEVPPQLKNVSVRTLDLGLLQAGAGVKGEFEQRLKNVIAEVKSSPIPIILFIDEAHSLIGAGGQAGQSDAANLLKPALARGELRTIAATTWSEYKKYFEKDHALVRRFQVVKVEEPEPQTAVKMLRCVAKSLEKHHKIRILDEAVSSAVELSHRYISGRKLPDKAVSLLDTACARVAIGQNSVPAVIEDSTRSMTLIQQEIEILNREQIFSNDHSKKIEELQTEHLEKETDCQRLQEKWAIEQKLLGEILEIRNKIEESIDGTDDIERQGLQDSLQTQLKTLESVQNKEPMVHINVDAEIIASIVSDWTGIPVGKMMTDEIQSVLQLTDRMKERLVGQDHALEAVNRRIRTSRAKLEDPGKPVGVFLLVGPSGVGKTETALTLAEILYGGEDKVISVNMSEYQEAHTVSSLKGAPPGYVGFGTGGVLTEAVRRRPFSVVLLDEVEKAHPDVMELFYQVFDKGIIEDGEGVEVNFKNTIILLTSNLGSNIITDSCLNSKERPSSAELVEKIRPQLLKSFKPALLGRLVIVPYYHLGDEHIEMIVKLKLDKIKQRFIESYDAVLNFNPELVQTIANRCTEVDSGARNVDSILTNTLLPGLSEGLLVKMSEQNEFNSVDITLDEDGQFKFKFSLD